MSDTFRSSAWSLKWEDICPQTNTNSDLAGSILNILGTLSNSSVPAKAGDANASLANGLLDLTNGTGNLSIESKLRPVASFSDLNAELSSKSADKQRIANGMDSKKQGAGNSVSKSPARPAPPSQPNRKDVDTRTRTQSNGRSGTERKQPTSTTKGSSRLAESPAKPSRTPNGGLAKKCTSATTMRTSNSADIADLVSVNLPDVVETDASDLLDEFETLLGRFGFSSAFTLRRPASAKANGLAAKANVASQLRHAIRELIDTERAYVADLDSLVNGYMREVHGGTGEATGETAVSGHAAESGLSETQLGTLFGNLPTLYGFHAELLAELNRVTIDNTSVEPDMLALAAAGGRVGSLLTQFSVRMGEYASYCTNFPRAIQLFSELQKEPQHAALLLRAQTRLGHPLPLPTYLLKPVQRILKYHLLVDSILKRLDTAGEAHAALSEAHAALLRVAHEINELKRRQDHRERGAQICTQLLPQLRKHVTTDDVTRMHMSMTTSMYEPAAAEQLVESSCARSHVRAEYTVPGSSVPNRLDVDMTTLFGELILEDDFALYGKKPSARWRCFLFDRALIITKCVPTETGAAGRARVKTVISSANLMLIESIANDPLSFHVIPFDNPRLQHTLQARSADQKREWCMQIKRLILENFAGGIPERSKQLFLKMTDELDRAPPAQPRRAPPKAAVDLAKSRFQYPEYLLNNKRRSLLPQPLQDYANGHGHNPNASASANANGTLKKRKSSLFPDLFGTLRPRGLRRSMTAYQRDAEAEAEAEAHAAQANATSGCTDADKMYRTLPVRGAKAKKAKTQKNASAMQEHAEPMKKRRSVESLTDVDCTLTFSDILSEYELARARGGIHVPSGAQNDLEKSKAAHAFVPMNFGALRKSALDRVDAVVDVAVDINLERQLASSTGGAPRGRVAHSRQGSSILTSNVTCPFYLVFDADADVDVNVNVKPAVSSLNSSLLGSSLESSLQSEPRRAEPPTTTARFASIDSSERQMLYDQACQLYLEKQTLTFDDMDAILKPLREHCEQQTAPDAGALGDKHGAARDEGEGEGEAEAEAGRSSPTDIVSQIALEQLLFRQIRRFQTGPKGLTPTSSLLALGSTLPSSSTPSESADSAYVTPLPKEAAAAAAAAAASGQSNGKSRARPISKTASLRGVKFGERSKPVTGECQRHEEDDEVSLSSSSGEQSPVGANQDPSLTIVSVDTAHGHSHRRQLSNQLKAALQSASETNLLTSAPFSLPADCGDSDNRGCYTPTISRRNRLLQPFRSIFGSQKTIAVHDNKPAKPAPLALTLPNAAKLKSPKQAKRADSIKKTPASKPTRPSKRRARKAKSELNVNHVNRELPSTTSSSRASAEREPLASPSIAGSLSPSFRSNSLRRRSSPSTGRKKGLLYRLFSYFQLASAKAQHGGTQRATAPPPQSAVTASPSISCVSPKADATATPTHTLTLSPAIQPVVVPSNANGLGRPPPVVPNALDLVQIPFVDDAPT